MSSINFWLLIFACLSFCASAKLEFVSAVEQIVLSEHRHDITGINLIIGLNQSDSRETNDFINELFFRIGSNISVRMINLNESLAQKTRLFFNVLLIDSIDSFFDLFDKMSKLAFPRSGYYLIVFENATSADLRMIFKNLWDLYIHNINVLSRDRTQQLTISTFVPFSDFGCNKTDAISFSEFKNGSFNYRPRYFFPNKFTNLHGCKIKVTTFESLAPAVMKHDYPNGSYYLFGRDVNIFTTLSQELNFYPDVHYILKYGGWGRLFPNGTATDSMGRAIRREADFILGNLYLKYDRSQAMSFSYTYFLDQIIVVIPPGKHFHSFKKLIRPFNIIVWIILGCTILITFAIITLLEVQSRAVRDLFYGERIRNPYMNVLIAIFGGSQHKTPRKNFPRSLLIIFLLFCLVMR